MPESSIGFYGYVKQYHNLKAEIDQAILDVLESGSYVLGLQLVRFEEELARYIKTKEAVGVNSGTDALWLVFWLWASARETRSSPPPTLFSPLQKPSGWPELLRYWWAAIRGPATSM